MLIASSANRAVRELLSRHPRIESVSEDLSPGVSFSNGSWNRQVLVQERSEALYGLVELMDNNPLVCADTMSVPSAAGTLALIALGPLATAGLLGETPTLVTNQPCNEDDLQHCLESAGWGGGVLAHTEPHPLDGVAVATAMAVIETPESVEEIFDLYDERFGKSFFVRLGSEEDWTPELVRGTPFAYYRLSVAEDSPLSLVTVRVLADENGKCGAAQVVHAMNVMCGFEEGLGISE